MKDYAGALIAFNRAISVDVNFFLAYNNRGVTLLEKGSLDDAIKDFEKALSINPKYAPAASNLSGIYFKRKDFKKAEELASKAITIDPNYASAYVNRGMAREMLRKMEEACSDWKKASDLGSTEGKTCHSGNCSN